MRIIGRVLRLKRLRGMPIWRFKKCTHYHFGCCASASHNLVKRTGDVIHERHRELVAMKGLFSADSVPSNVPCQAITLLEGHDGPIQCISFTGNIIVLSCIRCMTALRFSPLMTRYFHLALGLRNSFHVIDNRK